MASLAHWLAAECLPSPRPYPPSPHKTHSQPQPLLFLDFDVMPSSKLVMILPHLEDREWLSACTSQRRAGLWKLGKCYWQSRVEFCLGVRRGLVITQVDGCSARSGRTVTALQHEHFINNCHSLKKGERLKSQVKEKEKGVWIVMVTAQDRLLFDSKRERDWDVQRLCYF